MSRLLWTHHSLLTTHHSSLITHHFGDYDEDSSTDDHGRNGGSSAKADARHARRRRHHHPRHHDARDGETVSRETGRSAAHRTRRADERRIRPRRGGDEHAHPG